MPTIITHIEAINVLFTLLDILDTSLSLCQSNQTSKKLRLINYIQNILLRLLPLIQNNIAHLTNIFIELDPKQKYFAKQ